MESITATVLNNLIPITASKEGIKKSRNETITVATILNFEDRKLTKNEMQLSKPHRIKKSIIKKVNTLQRNGICPKLFNVWIGANKSPIGKIFA